MRGKNINNDKILFSVTDQIIDKNGKKCLIEVKFSKSFLNMVNCVSRNNFEADLSCGNFITDREKEVLRCLSKGNNNNQIAQKLNVSIHTTKAHIQSIFKKLSVKDRTEAVVYAIKNNLIDI